MRPLAPATLALLVCGLVPAAAQATAVRVVPGERTLSVTGDPGEANRVVIREPEPGVYVVEDPGSRRPMLAGDACERSARRRVVCRPADDLDAVSVLLRDRDDTLSVRGRQGTPITASGGTGDDRLVGGTAADMLGGGPGSDTLHGNGGGDALEGGEGDDRVFGGTGPDTLGGGEERGIGGDLLDGGRGEDTVSYDGRAGAVRVDLARQRGGRGGTEDRYRGVEGALGGDGDDTLLGDDGPNRLLGTAGTDRVSGRDGDDTLVGAAVLGGKGDDTLTFTARGSNCGGGTDTVVLPETVAYLTRSCELVAVETARGRQTVPARPVAQTEETLRFELLCDQPQGCRERRLRLLDTTTPPATIARPAVLADVPVPDAEPDARVQIDVPRTGALAPQSIGRSFEVAVDARTAFPPFPPSAGARGVYRVTLDL